MTKGARNLFACLAATLLGASALGETNRLIVELTPGTAPSQVASDYALRLVATAPAGAPFALFEVDSSRTDLVPMFMTADSRIAISDLDRPMELVEIDTTSRGGTIPVVGSVDHLDDENAGLLQQIGWSNVWRTAALRRFRVGVLDTGISPLATSMLPRCVLLRSQFGYANPVDAFDLPDLRYALDAPENQAAGHGTMVTGLLCEIAPNADVVVEKVADSSGTATTWTLISGLADAVLNKCSFANVSLGTPSHVPILQDAFVWASSRCLTVVAPAGNDASPVLLEPAAYPTVLAVAGVDSNDLKSAFSNWGSQTAASAPSVGIRSVDWNGQMAIWSGTSFAAPLVTGAVVLARGAGAYSRTDDLRSALQRNGDDLNALNPIYAGMLGARLNVARFTHPAATLAP